jgi:hypothetical protein
MWAHLVFLASKSKLRCPPHKFKPILSFWASKSALYEGMRPIDPCRVKPSKDSFSVQGRVSSSSVHGRRLAGAARRGSHSPGPRAPPCGELACGRMRPLGIWRPARMKDGGRRPRNKVGCFLIQLLSYG